MKKETPIDHACSEQDSQLTPDSEASENMEVSKEKQISRKKRMIQILKASGIVTLITLLIGVFTMIPDYLSWGKSVSDMKLSVINSENRYVYDSDVLKIGVSNTSDDDKFLTKAVIHITELRNDDSPRFVTTADLCDDGKGINVSICNTGWSDLTDVTVEADPDAKLYKNLKHPEAYELKLDVMQHGKKYPLGKLTAEDFIDPTSSSVPLKCTIKGEKEDYDVVQHGYYYNSSIGKFTAEGKGDRTEINHITYCIQSENGTGTFEYPLEFTCPAHKYQEINFAITVDRSCSASYFIELYAMDKPLLKTEEFGAHFTISSLNVTATPDSALKELY